MSSSDEMKMGGEKGPRCKPDKAPAFGGDPLSSLLASEKIVDSLKDALRRMSSAAACPRVVVQMDGAAQAGGEGFPAGLAGVRPSVVIPELGALFELQPSLSELDGLARCPQVRAIFLSGTYRLCCPAAGGTADGTEGN